MQFHYKSFKIREEKTLLTYIKVAATICHWYDENRRGEMEKCVFVSRKERKKREAFSPSPGENQVHGFCFKEA